MYTRTCLSCWTRVAILRSCRMGNEAALHDQCGSTRGSSATGIHRGASRRPVGRSIPRIFRDTAGRTHKTVGAFSGGTDRASLLTGVWTTRAAAGYSNTGVDRLMSRTDTRASARTRSGGKRLCCRFRRRRLAASRSGQQTLCGAGDSLETSCLALAKAIRRSYQTRPFTPAT